MLQVEIHPAAGRTCPAALRSTLRSAPNVIALGAIRDPESLALCLEASLMGHLVLAVLQVEDAAAALQRMVEMSGDPLVVADATKLVVSQRLVRKLCTRYSREEPPGDELLEWARSAAESGGLDWATASKRFRSATGCPECMNTGYRGRNVIAEALEVTPGIRAALRERAATGRLRAVAIEQGMISFSAHGILKASPGFTTLGEIARHSGSSFV
ncbi:MAG: Flp pilus assembly complex ATPase component TadA [Planctomycetes bacterium]|nr:Flp pilus assembly complex ATPase component TadA [Planctomycetota bacterium]